ncbi:hypothetical protein EB18_01916 [Enterococcus cecorum]|uniref:Uncharacterized protein n=1 Tax=Enterococcus cecorum TaxID=44008 RepID=A0A366SFA5_9ENTE|nr:hypothetical protein EB18_01916 [Enterococcus cecorum]
MVKNRASYIIKFVKNVFRDSLTVEEMNELRQ